ncbi:MAG TPA: response regulator [Verrucomicrobia bacterium]|nr:MAG: response regulator [Lentisphaerae bacterium GWF2_57_35]HBA85101.1 response regulator [Verrucomicrobiota bacterium]
MTEEHKQEEAPASLTEHTISVLLIDDQAMVGEAVRRMLQPEKDIRFLYCKDPAAAVKTAEEFGPTVILQDLVMPDIDGLTLVKYFRANAKTRDVPLIVLSTKEEPRVKADAFALGANDYLVKLPDRIELIARIRYHSRGYINLLQRNEVMQRLVDELSEAAQYVKNILPAPVSEGPIATDWRFISSTSLGGDAFGYHWLDADHFALYLLDVCGHGVGAALLSVTVMNVLRSQTLPHTDFQQPEQVLSALNENFQMENQNGMYFTIWYGVYNKSTRRMAYASGGHPAALYMVGGGPTPSTVQRLETRNMVIGGMPGIPFRKAECELSLPGRLYIFSDGCYEVTKPDGKVWTFDEFAAFMTEAPAANESRMDRLLHQARAYEGTENLPDDFSILEVVFK